MTSFNGQGSQGGFQQHKTTATSLYQPRNQKKQLIEVPTEDQTLEEGSKKPSDTTDDAMRALFGGNPEGRD